MGKGHAQNQMPQFVNQDPNQVSLDDIMMNMNSAWSDSINKFLILGQKIAQAQIIKENLMLQNIWRQEKLKEEEMMRRQLQFEQQWRKELEMQAANDWKNDFIENEVLNHKEREMNEVTSI